MALIQCPECFKEVSDKAGVCLNCGFPVAKHVEKQKKLEKIKKEAENEAYLYVKRKKKEEEQKEKQAKIAEECRKNEIYYNALYDLESEQIDSVVKACDAFKSINIWKDSEAKIVECEQKIKLLHEKAQIKREENRKKKKIAAIIGCVVIVIVIFTSTVIVPNVNKAVAYNSAKKLLNNGKFDDAIEIFKSLDEYRDSEIFVMEVQYQRAKYLVDNGEYENALAIYASLGDYADSKEQIDLTEYIWKNPLYQNAILLMNNGSYREAINAFNELNGYMDAAELVERCGKLKKEADYQIAMNALDEYDYEKAITYFEYADDYADSIEQRKAAIYQYGCSLINEEKYYEGINQLKLCIEYLDSYSRILDAEYSYVQENKNNEDINTYKYLKELIGAGYSEASIIYSQIYAWKLTFTKIESYDRLWNRIEVTELNTQQSAYIYFTVSGGPPGENIRITAKYKTPYGTEKTEIIKGTYENGSEGYFYWMNIEYYTGTFSVQFYDHKGNEIGSKSINVVSYF